MAKKSKIWKKAQQWLRSQGWGGNVKKYANSNMNSMNDYRNFKRAARAHHAPKPVVHTQAPSNPNPDHGGGASGGGTSGGDPGGTNVSTNTSTDTSTSSGTNWQQMYNDLMSKYTQPAPVPVYTPPPPPPPPPKMTTAGAADIGAGSTALGVKTAAGPGAELNIGSTGDVFGRKKKKEKKTPAQTLLPISGITG